MFDPRCKDLARDFLPDDAQDSAAADALAQVIQDAIEGWLSDYEAEPTKPDGTPIYPSKLTRNERLQGKADRNCDSHEEARGER